MPCSSIHSLRTGVPVGPTRLRIIVNRPVGRLMLFGFERIFFSRGYCFQPRNRSGSHKDSPDVTHQSDEGGEQCAFCHPFDNRILMQIEIIREQIVITAGIASTATTPIATLRTKKHLSWNCACSKVDCSCLSCWTFRSSCSAFSYVPDNGCAMAAT